MMTVRKLVLVGVFLILATATRVRASDVDVFLKLGFVANHGDEFSDPFGFKDRLVYKGGVDVRVADLVWIGPEFQYQRISASETMLGSESSFTNNLYTFFGNITLAPRETAFRPFAGAGIGVAHGTSTVTGGGITFVGFSDTKAAFHVFGGVGFGPLIADIELYRILESGADTNAVLDVGVRF